MTTALLIYIAYAVLTRLIYLWYLTSIENREFNKDKDPEDFLVTSPIVGDVVLFLITYSHLMALASRAFMNIKNGKYPVKKWMQDYMKNKSKLSSQRKEIKKLEERVKTLEPESLKETNRLMIEAIKEVNSVARKV